MARAGYLVWGSGLRLVRALVWAFFVLGCVRASATPQVRTLPNGLRVVVSPEPGSGRVAAVLMVRAGDADDPAGASGTARMLARVLMDPINHRPSARFDEYDVPGAVWVDPEMDVTAFSAVTTPDRVAAAIRRLGLIVEPPLWNNTLTMRSVQREGALEREEVPDNWLQDFLAWQAKAGLPVPPAAEPQPPGREALRDFYERLYVPDRMVLAVVGDVSPDAVEAEAEEAFPMPGSRFVRPEPRRGRSDAPEHQPVTGAYAFVGYAAPAATSPDAPAVEVFAASIGRGKTSSLFRRLREGEGTGYESGVVYPRRLTRSGVALFALAPGTAADVRDELVALWRDAAGVSGDPEFWESARARAAHAYLAQHQTARDRAYWLAFWETAGKGAAFDAEYTRMLRRVPLGDIKAAAERFLAGPPVGIP